MKVVKGTDRKDRVLQNELVLPAIDGLPKPPSYIDTTAKKLWRKLVKELHPIGLLSKVDDEILGGYCQCHSFVVTALKDIKASGLYMEYTNKNGSKNLVPHPAVKLYNDNLEKMNKLAAQYGLTPSARAKMTMPDKGADEDPMSKFLGNG